jgi:hypothetical protein
MNETQKEKPQSVLAQVLGPGFGQVNVLIKNLMGHMGIDDPFEAVRRVNSGEWMAVPRLSIVFDPITLLGEGWSLSDENQLPLAPIDIDYGKIEFVGVLKDGESSINGLERDKRLHERRHLHLGPEHFLRFWKDRQNLPESWKNIGFITFDAMKLRAPNGNLCVLSLCRGGGPWLSDCVWLGFDFSSYNQSAVVSVAE